MNYFGLLLKEKVCPRKQTQKKRIIKSGQRRVRDGRVRLIGEGWGENDMRGNLQWEEKR